jgi:hypothetical protein
MERHQKYMTDTNTIHHMYSILPNPPTPPHFHYLYIKCPRPILKPVFGHKSEHPIHTYIEKPPGNKTKSKKQRHHALEAVRRNTTSSKPDTVVPSLHFFKSSSSVLEPSQLGLPSCSLVAGVSRGEREEV